MRHLQQPKRSKTCGQHCVAMLAGVPVEQVVSKAGEKATKPAELLKIAASFGLKQKSNLWVLIRGDYELPNNGILKLRKPRRKNFHWACVVNGQIHDPSQDAPGKLANCHEIVAFMPVEK